MKIFSKKPDRVGLLALYLIAGFSLVPFTSGDASADSLTGVLDIGYARSESKTADSFGVKTNTQSSGFSQQYRLALNKSFYPNLNMNAAGIFDKAMTDSDSGGRQTSHSYFVHH